MLAMVKIITVSQSSPYWEKRNQIEGQIFLLISKGNHPIRNQDRLDRKFYLLKLKDPLSIYFKNSFIVRVEKYEEITDGPTDPGAHDQQGADQAYHE
jgi:hypothetical protein